MNIISEPTTRAITEIRIDLKLPDGSWRQQKITDDQEIMDTLEEFELCNKSTVFIQMDWQERGDHIDFFVGGENGVRTRLLGDFLIDWDGNAISPS